MLSVAPIYSPLCPLCRTGMVGVDADANDRTCFSCPDCGGVMELSAVFEGMRLSLGLRLAAAVLPRGTFEQIVETSDPIALAKGETALSTAYWRRLECSISS